MARGLRIFSHLLLLGGVLLLAKGTFSLFPFLFPSTHQPAPAAGLHSEPGSYPFRLSFPRERAAFDVIEGTTEEALRIAPGHLEGSPLPGESGNVVIAGHRDTHFRILRNVAIGDEIRIDTEGKTYFYRIVATRIVSPDDLSVIRPEPGSVLTLITCYPFSFIGPAPSRFVVQAHIHSAQVHPTPSAQPWQQ